MGILIRVFVTESGVKVPQKKGTLEGKDNLLPFTAPSVMLA